MSVHENSILSVYSTNVEALKCLSAYQPTSYNRLLIYLPVLYY